MFENLISITNGSISHTGQPIIRDVNIVINKGEHWAIVGGSGSGKTSLLNVIAGNLQLRQGQITRWFNDADHIPDFHQHIAFVGTKPYFKNLSNTSNFYYQQRYNSSDSGDALTVVAYLCTIVAPLSAQVWDIDKTISMLRLSHLGDKQIIKLSNGETKRLLIAAALLKNPSLLLLDNPMAGLDVKTRTEFDDIITQIAATGITIVMATSAHEIPQTIRHIAVLRDGTLKQINKAEFQKAYLPESSTYNIDFDLTGLLGNYPAKIYRQIVAMNHVQINYGDKVVLNNVNWQIKQGERWALLGPNGAGKSTLLSLINGDNPQAYANDITLFDNKRGSGESIWDIKGKTGFISPELCQYFPTDSNCLQAIESGYYDTMGLFRQSDKGRAERALHWMRMLEIEKYAGALLKNIPAGAQRLCLLARAMIKNPALLILDEPCQGMDDHQVQYFKTVVDTICRQTNITLIYVTHYAEHIPDNVRHVLRLEAGRVISNS